MVVGGSYDLAQRTQALMFSLCGAQGPRVRVTVTLVSASGLSLLLSTSAQASPWACMHSGPCQRMTWGHDYPHTLQLQPNRLTTHPQPG